MDEENGEEPMEMMSINKSKEPSDDDPPPPDNGPFYCSMCNWLRSFYDRFDNSFIAFFMI